MPEQNGSTTWSNGKCPWSNLCVKLSITDSVSPCRIKMLSQYLRFWSSVGHVLLFLLILSKVEVICPDYTACMKVLLRDMQAKQGTSVSYVPSFPSGSGTGQFKKIACLYERGGCGVSNVWKTSAGAEIEDNAGKIRHAGTPLYSPTE